MSKKKQYPCKHGCGKTLATRAGIWKHENKCEQNTNGLGVEPQLEDSVSPASFTEGESPSEATPFTEDSQPSYANFTFEEQDVEGQIPVPTALRFVAKKAGDDKKGGKKKSKAEILNMTKSNEAMLKMGYKTVDNLASKYRVGITNDESMTINHSEADYNWISGITNAYLMERGFDINSYIGTGKAAIVCNAWWFGSIGSTLHNDAKKLDKKLNIIRTPISWGRKLLSFIPIIGKRFKKKPEIDTVGQIVGGSDEV